MPTPVIDPDDVARSSAPAPLAERAQAPAVLVPPPDGGGLVWRPLTQADGAALVSLVSRIEDADNPPYRTSAEETLEYFHHSHRWSALGAWEADRLVAFGFVRVRHGDTVKVRAFCSGGVTPERRGQGLGGALLDWQIGRARQMLAESEREAPARIVVHVDDDMEVLAGQLRRRGFEPRRWYSQLRRDLSLPIPDVRLDRPLSVEPWTPEIDDAVRRAHNKAFGDQWGSQPHTPETWAEGRTHHAPSWSFVALDRSSDRAQVAGYLMSSRYDQDWPALGWSEGYTEILGVLPDWRGKHVATALLTRAMRAYADDGMQYAGLDVDADNPTGATALFMNLGYERTRGSAMYTIEI
ncbi:acetyltransferase (GNAT) family protein [Georgenia soli]|uniref:Acetyltransferase (GNAT) family protein n=1 Tax=Georgenia soli TaxID=638953 RepID=A0A2A9EFQ7_9MICO|nr:GNAT family N-acetyltransferase [Georgenia soli]PFG37897.1 acetyltransferase (GNAT) family protein [Georgenia soli]